MDEQNPHRDKAEANPDVEAFPSRAQLRQNRLDRKRAKIVAEIQRNRRGEFTVPTWVLTALLLLIIAGVAAVIIFAG